MNKSICNKADGFSKFSTHQVDGWSGFARFLVPWEKYFCVLLAWKVQLGVPLREHRRGPERIGGMEIQKF
jgi:hypothetical protein